MGQRSSFEAPIDTRGRVTIPEPIRTELDIGPSDRVRTIVEFPADNVPAGLLEGHDEELIAECTEGCWSLAFGANRQSTVDEFWGLDDPDEKECPRCGAPILIHSEG